MTILKVLVCRSFVFILYFFIYTYGIMRIEQPGHLCMFHLSMTPTWSNHSKSCDKTLTDFFNYFLWTICKLLINNDIVFISYRSIWQPYDDMSGGLPHYYVIENYNWCTISPLIYFHMVEWHRPDRVMQQFEFQHGVPQLYDNDSTWRQDFNWVDQHGDYIWWWAFQREMVFCPLGYHDPYIVWYHHITIQFLTQLWVLSWFVGNFLILDIY